MTSTNITDDRTKYFKNYYLNNKAKYKKRLRKNFYCITLGGKEYLFDTKKDIMDLIIKKTKEEVNKINIKTSLL